MVSTKRRMLKEKRSFSWMMFLEGFYSLKKRCPQSISFCFCSLYAGTCVCKSLVLASVLCRPLGKSILVAFTWLLWSPGSPPESSCSKKLVYFVVWGSTDSYWSIFASWVLVFLLAIVFVWVLVTMSKRHPEDVKCTSNVFSSLETYVILFF